MATPHQLDHAITNALFHYHRINADMPANEISQRFTALWTALDHLNTEHEKANHHAAPTTN